MKNAAILLSLTVLALLSSAADPAPDLDFPGPGEEEAVSEPSQRSKRSVMFPGIVREVLVKEGQPVKDGQVVIQLDDRIEQKMLEEAALEADSEARVNYARQDLELKKVQLKRVEGLHAKGVGSAIELEEAQSAVNLAMASLQVAELDHRKNQLIRDRQAEKVEQLRIRSPFDGHLAKLNVREGEMADPSLREGVFLVVRNDPLHIQLALRAEQAAQLKMGEELQVRYRGQSQWMPARIIMISPVADPTSNYQDVKLELPNPNNVVSGRQVIVKLPERLTPKVEAASADPK